MSECSPHLNPRAWAWCFCYSANLGIARTSTGSDSNANLGFVWSTTGFCIRSRCCHVKIPKEVSDRLLFII